MIRFSVSKLVSCHCIPLWSSKFHLVIKSFSGAKGGAPFKKVGGKTFLTPHIKSTWGGQENEYNGHRNVIGISLYLQHQARIRITKEH